MHKWEAVSAHVVSEAIKCQMFIYSLLILVQAALYETKIEFTSFLKNIFSHKKEWYTIGIYTFLFETFSHGFILPHFWAVCWSCFTNIHPFNAAVHLN